jgi:hypothetical protein
MVDDYVFQGSVRIGESLNKRIMMASLNSDTANLEETS